MHLLFVIHMGLNPRRKLYNRRGDESGCILSQANTQKTAVKVHSPQRGAEGGLDSGIFPSPAPYKKADGSSVCFLYITKWELNPRRKPYNRREGESGCILSQANTQETAVKVRSPQRGAEGGLDSGIFPSPAFCYYNTLPT